MNPTCITIDYKPPNQKRANYRFCSFNRLKLSFICLNKRLLFKNKIKKYVGINSRNVYKISAQNSANIA